MGPDKYIPIGECKHGYLYRIACRNLIIGVYNEPQGGFVGIRTKFGSRFLFTEYHWDTGEPFGTVQPVEILEECPLTDLSEYHFTPHIDGLKPDDASINQPLFNWLERKEKKYAEKTGDQVSLANPDL